MDDALALDNLSRGWVRRNVLILVVMDDALAHRLRNFEEMKISLNPCCNG